VLAGEFVVVNRHMLKDLVEGGYWTKDTRNQIIADGGSIQRVSCIPVRVIMRACHRACVRVCHRVIE
jgi:hypothetical protein